MNINDGFDVVFVGVGGQGVVLAADILAEAAMKTGFDVKKTDVLGMAQRGGSVISQVRFAKEIASPITQRGDANYLVGFEKLETARYANFLREDGVTLMNDYKQEPVSVINGIADYPNDQQIKAEITKYGDNLIKFLASEKAVELGNSKVVSVIMIGALSMFLPISKQTFLDAILNKVPAKAAEINQTAFKAGRDLVLAEIMKAEPADLSELEENADKVEFPAE